MLRVFIGVRILRKCWERERERGEKSLMKVVVVYGKVVKKSVDGDGRNGSGMRVRELKL